MDGQSKERANQWERGFGLETVIFWEGYMYIWGKLSKMGKDRDAVH